MTRNPHWVTGNGSRRSMDLHDLLIKYGDCFLFGFKDLGFTRADEIEINIEILDSVVYV